MIGIVSSVSARKLTCPSLARLGTFIARARSSRKIPARTHLYQLCNFIMHSPKFLILIMYILRFYFSNIRGTHRKCENLDYATKYFAKYLTLSRLPFFGVGHGPRGAHISIPPPSISVLRHLRNWC